MAKISIEDSFSNVDIEDNALMVYADGTISTASETMLKIEDTVSNVRVQKQGLEIQG